MPNLDGTGPHGKGSKTGRGMGNCRPKQQATEHEPGNGRRGRGAGRGAGRGKGLGRGTK